MVINDDREQVLNFEYFSRGLCYRSLSQNDLNCFKNRLGTCGFAAWQFFLWSNPERFFSFWKKTIVLYLFKKFETFMVIFTSGRRRVFFKKTILYICFTDNPFNTEFASKFAISILSWSEVFWKSRSFSKSKLEKSCIKLWPTVIVTEKDIFYHLKFFLNMTIRPQSKIDNFAFKNSNILLKDYFQREKIISMKKFETQKNNSINEFYFCPNFFSYCFILLRHNYVNTYFNRRFLVLS